MNLQATSWPEGLVLNQSVMETRINSITAHQLTSLDLADGFGFGFDLPMNGFGILAARHLNGTLTDARYFLGGNDSAAIQAAIDFIGATSEAQGVVYIAPKAGSGKWVLDTQITVPSNVTIMGPPDRTRMELAFNGYAFILETAAANIAIENLELDADDRSGSGFVDTTDTAESVTIRNCQVGSRSGASGEKMRGYLLRVNGAAYHNRIIGNRIFGGGYLYKATGSGSTYYGCEIIDNRIDTPVDWDKTTLDGIIDLTSIHRVRILRNTIRNYTTTAAATEMADFILNMTSCDYAEVKDNYFLGGVDSAVYLDGCDDLSFSNNTVLNGGHGAAVAVPCMVMTACDRARVWSNTITCDANLIASGTRSTYGLTLDASCDDCALWDNLFEEVEDSTNVASSPYACATAGLLDGGTNTRRWNNRYFQDQVKRVTGITTGSASQAITLNGIATSGTGRYNQIRSVQLTAEGSNQETFCLSSIGNNTITVRAAGAATINNTICHVRVDG